VNVKRNITQVKRTSNTKVNNDNCKEEQEQNVRPKLEELRPHFILVLRFI
jgi:hypothetical protein